ncbi:hypothetical protein ACRRTK_003164 [Alexandromys fortis]
MARQCLKECSFHVIISGHKLELASGRELGRQGSSPQLLTTVDWPLRLKRKLNIADNEDY